MSTSGIRRAIQNPNILIRFAQSRATQVSRAELVGALVKSLRMPTEPGGTLFNSGAGLVFDL